MVFRCIVSILFLMAPGLTAAQSDFKPNYDESKVPAYTLPDPLVFADGRKVETADDWRNERRAEILRLFEEEVFGKTPSAKIPIRFEERESSRDALEGRAIRKQVRIHFSDQADGPDMDLLVYIPADAKGPVPIILVPNWYGNQTIYSDPEVFVSGSWMRENDDLGIVNNRATEASRGKHADRWAVDLMLERGYGHATFCYSDLDPDYDDGFQNGVQPLFYREGQTQPAADEWGAIGAWAWGLSRAMDYFETDPEIDAGKVAVMGHSRLGKTALWAGAQDERFAIVISNNSGCGGAALSRRRFGETVGRINRAFPHWFCDNFNKYNDDEDSLPVDQHQLIALIAPRPVYAASAEEDRWADPLGEFLSLVHAEPVYLLLGTDGLGTDKLPDLNQPVGKTMGYHIRTGKHDVLEFDWKAYLDFADRHFGR